MAEPTAKQTAGLGLLSSLKIDFDSVHETLGKILSNIVSSPAEPKYRKLRTTNAKIEQLLSALGAKQLLLGSGFVHTNELTVCMLWQVWVPQPAVLLVVARTMDLTL